MPAYIEIMLGLVSRIVLSYRIKKIRCTACFVVERTYIEAKHMQHIILLHF